MVTPYLPAWFDYHPYSSWGYCLEFRLGISIVFGEYSTSRELKLYTYVPVFLFFVALKLSQSGFIAIRIAEGPDGDVAYFRETDFIKWVLKNNTVSC